ncbi:MAG: sulfatase [Planctomycetia bacterium]|nr:sulfatase [Planctomycetia bacterium]
MQLSRLVSLSTFALVVTNVLFLAPRTEAADDKPSGKRSPNFIIINIDDLGYADIGPFGGKVPTPHLDRMAREGLKLTSHYAAPVCSPSRASLMTGCYPKRVLPTPHVLFPVAAVGLNPDEVTIAEVLKSAGYDTACIGKWHLGDQPEFLPTRQGFDSYFGIPYSNDMGLAAEGSKSNLGAPLPKEQPNAKTNAAKNTTVDETGLRGDAQPPLPLLENEKVFARVRAAEQATFTGRYTERAVKFIGEHRDRPFFLYLPHGAIHFPFYPAPEFVGRSKTEQSKSTLHGDWIMEIDASVGRVLDAVREAGLEENTLVVFTSDNGGPQASSNVPLRGSKGSTLEGGMRVCTIAWWPKRIAPGTSSAAITSMMDLLPTFAALAGTKPAAERKIDGVDIRSVLLGPAEAGAKSGRDVFHYFRGLTLEAVRRGPWKLHLAKQELYHLGDDIGEAKNVASAQPEIVKQLSELAAAMDADLGATGLGPGVRPLGRVTNPLPLIDHDGKIRSGFE